MILVVVFVVMVMFFVCESVLVLRSSTVPVPMKLFVIVRRDTLEYLTLNQSRHERRSNLAISKYLSEIFAPSHIKLTNNKPNKDFKSVSDPKKSRILNKIIKFFWVEKYKERLARDSNAMPPRHSLESYPLHHNRLK